MDQILREYQSVKILIFFYFIFITNVIIDIIYACIFAAPASCKFLKRYLDEINLHGLPGILLGVKLMTDHNNAFLQITLFDKKSQM